MEKLETLVINAEPTEVKEEQEGQEIANYFKPYSKADQCDHNPEFAVICSFIAHFGDKIDLQLDIENLKTAIEDQSKLDENLIEIHVKLLKKIRRYFLRDQWEKALVKFVAEYSYEDAYELEQLGYLKTRPSIKLELLRRLLDIQFEVDQKFKASVNLSEANELRLQPIGRDLRGNSYWQQKDNEGNFRIFREQPLDCKIWETVCTKPEELNYLIEDLDKSKDDKVKGEPIIDPYNPYPELFPELFTKEIETKLENDEEENTKTKTKKGSRSMKGRSKLRGKKSSPLPILKEAEEEQEHIHVRNCINSNSQIQEKSTKTEDEANSSKFSITLRLSPIPNLDTIESQVKSTLESLITRVVSSFEYFLKSTSKSPAHTSPQIQDQPTQNNSKKKRAKREKPPREELPRRASSRIQQQMELKRIAEEEMKKAAENEKRSAPCGVIDEDSRSRTSFKGNKRRSESPEETKNRKKRRRGGKSWKRGKGKKKLSWDKDDSDLSSISSITESNEDDDFDDVDISYNAANDDDEFACEEEDTNEPVIVKRARTARQSLGGDEGSVNNSTIIEEDKPCGRCDKSNDPEWILLCDNCDAGYHTSCCLPPLMFVPDGDWFCPPCEHNKLLEKLRELYAFIIDLLEAKELERVKRQRLRQNHTKKEKQVKAEPQILQEKRQRDILNELNEPVAMQTLDEILGESSDAESRSSYTNGRSKKRTKAKQKNSKRYRAKRRNSDSEEEYRGSGRTYSKRDRFDSDDESEEEYEEASSESSEEDKPKTRRARASVSYRFQEYDELIKSAIQGDTDNEDQSSEKESESEECNYGRGKDMATIEALAYQQENGITESNGQEQQVSLSKPKPRRRGRRLNDLDADTETEGATSDESFQASSANEAEEDDDDDLTEANSCSEESETSIDEILASKRTKSKRSKKKKGRRFDRYESDDDDDEYQPTRTRRAAAAAKVSYKESTDEEEEEEELKVVKKTKKNTLESDEESQASWKSSVHEEVLDEDCSTSCDDSQDNLDAPLEIDQNAHSPDQISDDEYPKQYEELTTASEKRMKSEAANNMLGGTVKEESKITKTNNCSMNESVDEIAEPLYRKKHSSNELIQQTGFVGTNLEPKLRDPIQELIRYCSESANSATMFNSYSETLTNKNQPNSSPIHPPFYDDDNNIKPLSTPEKGV